MRVNNLITKSFLAVTALLGSVTMVGCVADSDEAVPVGSGESSLVININSSSVGATTRSTDLTTAQGDNEKKVSNMLVSIYNAAGDTKVATIWRDFTTTTAGSISINATSATPVTEEVKNTVAVLAEGQKALIACNINDATHTALAAAANIDAYKAVENNIDAALVGAASTAIPWDNSVTTGMKPEMLPMFGQGTVAANGSITGAFKIDVVVKHIVAKVSLAALTLDCDDEFRLNRVFLVNVPEKFVWDYEAAAPFFATNTKFFQGNAAGDATYDYVNNLATPAVDNQDKQFRNYLSSDVIASTTIDKDNALATPYYFYTMPNNHATILSRLVIEGYWTVNGQSEDTDPCYYSIKLQNMADNGNAGLTASIKPNHNYVLRVVLKRAGLKIADVPDAPYNDSFPTSNTLNVKMVETQDWDAQENDEEFGPNGGA